MRFETAGEFMAALGGSIDRLCDGRSLRALAIILPGCMAFNGMTDGWHELHASLRRLLSLSPAPFSKTDWTLIHDLIQGADRVCRPAVQVETPPSR